MYWTGKEGQTRLIDANIIVTTRPTLTENRVSNTLKTSVSQHRALHQTRIAQLKQRRQNMVLREECFPKDLMPQDRIHDVKKLFK